MMFPRIPLLSCVAGLAIASSTALAQEPRMTELTIDLAAPGYAFKGWGTSLAWWAHGMSSWDEARVDEVVRYVTDPVAGLGLTIFRYNIGGGEAPGHPPHLRRWGDVPGFKLAPDADYDWSADAGQRRVLLKLIKASSAKPIVEAFSNSPPWWMTKSGCVAGNVDGSENLKPEFEGAFADYLADVAKHYRDAHGLTFDSLEPVNEPDAHWWKSSNNQEGCHVGREQQARLIRLSRAALDARGLTSTIVSGTDANRIDEALRSVRSFDEPTLASLGRINTHSYEGRRRAELRDLAAQLGKPLWQSETGPLHVGGTEYEQILKVADRLVLDLNELRPEVWCTWQIIDNGPWGSLHYDRRDRTVTPSKQFHMLATFTRAIRPGDRILPQPSPHVLVAASDERRTATVVLVNKEKAPRSYTLTVKRDGWASITTVAARTDEAEGLKEIASPSTESGTIRATVPAESIVRLTVSPSR